MSRDQDVKCVGRVIEFVSPPDEQGRGAVFTVDIDDQEGEHITGRLSRVTARQVQARSSMRMLDSGVRVRPGDLVAVLVNPWSDPSGRINTHVCVCIAIVRGVTWGRR